MDMSATALSWVHEYNSPAPTTGLRENKYKYISGAGCTFLWKTHFYGGVVSTVMYGKLVLNVLRTSLCSCKDDPAEQLVFMSDTRNTSHIPHHTPRHTYTHPHTYIHTHTHRQAVTREYKYITFLVAV
jgi:hypothetical protein